MAYKYPRGAKSPNAIIADVIATVSWVDTLLDMKLPHMFFPIPMGSPVDQVDKVMYRKYNKFRDDVIRKMSYRQKVDMFFAVVDINDLKFGDKLITQKQIKMLFIYYGEFRNKIAHSPVVAVIPNRHKLPDDSIAVEFFYDGYEQFHKAYKVIKPVMNNVEKSMSGRQRPQNRSNK
jgi:hypothetical protein